MRAPDEGAGDGVEPHLPAPPAAHPGPPPDVSALQPLDRRVTKAWRVSWLVAAELFGLAFIVAPALADAPRLLVASLAAGALLYAAAAVLHPRARYRSWGYRRRADDLLVRRGVLWRTVSIVPHARIQYVDTRRGPLERIVTWTIALLSVPAIVLAIARYFTFRYRVEGDELVIDPGLPSRRHRVIPLARIQNIDVHETALQRICGVAELRVETAGGGETEARLRVLSRERAHTLGDELLAGWRAAAPGSWRACPTATCSSPARRPARPASSRRSSPGRRSSWTTCSPISPCRFPTRRRSSPAHPGMRSRSWSPASSSLSC